MYAKTTLTLALAMLATGALANDDQTRMGEPDAATSSFSTLDVNGDGSISRDEAASSSAIVDQWDTLDADRDGALSSTEYEAASQSHEMYPDESSSTRPSEVLRL